MMQGLQICLLIIFSLLYQSYSWCYKTKFVQSNKINCLDYSPDGSMILTASDSKKMTIWNAKTFQIIFVYTYNNKIVQTAKFSKDQQLIAIGFNGDSTIKILSGSSPFGQIASFSGSHSTTYQVDFSQDSQKLVTCGTDEQVRMWAVDASSTSWNEDYNQDTGDIVYTCKFTKSTSSHTVGYGNSQQVGKIKDDGDTYRKSSENYDIFYSIDFGPSGIFSAANKNNKGYLAQSSGGGSSISLSTMADYSDMRTTSYSRDGSYILFAGDSQKGYLFFENSSQNNPEEILFQSNSIIYSSVFSYDSNILLLGTQDGAIYVYHKICSGCPTGFYPGVTKCQPCSLYNLGCNICYNSSYCLTCFDGYYLNSTSHNCLSCDSNTNGCSFCTNTGTCLACSPGYYLSGTSCAYCHVAMPGCRQCNATNYCYGCQFKYYLHTDNTCQPCSDIPFCLYCNTSNYCLQCQPGFYNNSGSCALCPSNCSFCNSNTNCIQCITGYYPVTGICTECGDFCTSCNRTGTCKNCISGYYLNGANSCTQCVQPCYTCNSSTYCISCQTGFYISAVGSCSQCVYPCITCDNSTGCRSCDTGFYLTTGFLCDRCSVLYTNCQTCNTTACLDCIEGYYIDGSGNCVLCSSAMNYCDACSDNTHCQICLQGFYHTGTTGATSCASCSIGCSSCYNGTNCTNCYPKYYLSTGSCIKCVNNCLTCSSNLVCLSCVTGYFVDGTICRSCGVNITNCLDCINQTYCLACNQNSYLNTAKTQCIYCPNNCATCDSSGCITCQLGFHLSGISCSRCPASCIQCVSSTNCSSCVPGKYLQTATNTCLQCTTGCNTCTQTACLTCISSYILDTGVCRFCLDLIDNCIYCDALTTCLQCSYGFIPTSVNTVCSPCSTINGCEHCNTTSYCLICANGFYSNGAGSCLNCSDGCSACSSGSACLSCLPKYLLNGANSCDLCQDLMQGCEYCSGSTTCTNCVEGYYLTAPSCSLCRNTIEGCRYCNSSSICTLCYDQFYLHTDNLCYLCSTGCQHCNSSSVCIQCQSGYYLNGNVCTDCSFISGCATCTSSTCSICKSGYYLNSGNCLLCQSAKPSCIYCTDSSTCLQCEAGSYLDGGSNSCLPCTGNGCQVCNSTSPLLCITCNSEFYLNSSTKACDYCRNVLSGCVQCNSLSICTRCQAGYYVTGSGSCQQCSVPLAGCQQCSSSASCIQCQSGYYLNGLTCDFCGTLLPGCAYCASSSVCLSCQTGYYINGAGCDPCTNIAGCFMCYNSSQCVYCLQQYYLENGACNLCNTTNVGCITCSSGTICTACSGQYKLAGTTCTELKGSFPKEEADIKFLTTLKNEKQLKHNLKLQGSTYTKKDQNWTSKVKIKLIDETDTEANLTINSAEWGSSGYQLFFYTNNPVDFKGKMWKKMPIARLLLEGNLPAGYKTKLQMDQAVVNQILPAKFQTTNLIMDYDLSDAAFYKSVIAQSSSSYLYFLFGLILTFIMLILYVIKATVSASTSDDKGQIIPHILSLKCGALILYPTYSEFINFCYGFMSADFPWLNAYIAQYLVDISDDTPNPYLLFYLNMNIASTYLVALIIIGFLWFTSFLLSIGISEKHKNKVYNFQSFLYNFFILGCVVASTASMIGAVNNSLSQFNANSIFYIVGICLFIGIMIDTLYSLIQYRQAKLYKLRILVKGVLLSFAYQSPVSIFISLIVIDSIFAAIQCKLLYDIKPYPKLWLTAHLLVNAGFVLFFFMPQMMISFILVGLFLILALILDSYIHLREFITQKIIQDVKLRLDLGKNTFNDSKIFNIDNMDADDEKKFDNINILNFDETGLSFSNQTKSSELLKGQQKRISRKKKKKEIFIPEKSVIQEQPNDNMFIAEDFM